MTHRDLCTPIDCEPPTHAPIWAVNASYMSTDGSQGRKDGSQEGPEYASSMYHFDLPAAGTPNGQPVESDSESDFVPQSQCVALRLHRHKML